MTDARTLFVKVHIDTDTDRFAVWKDGLDWVECDLGPHLAAAAEATALRERVAALEGLARRVTSAQVYEAPGDPCQGLDVGFVRALRLLYEVVTSPAPTPATDEARCGYPGCTAPDAHGKSVCMGGGVCAAHHPFQPTPATDEARCGWCGGSGRIVSGFKVCPKCNGLGHQPTPTEPACFLCRRTKDEHAARTDLLHTFTPEPAPRAVAYGSIPGSDDWVMADPEPGS